MEFGRAARIALSTHGYYLYSAGHHGRQKLVRPTSSSSPLCFTPAFLPSSPSVDLPCSVPESAFEDWCMHVGVDKMQA